MERMDITKISDEKIEDIFAEAFEKQIASEHNISEFECKCKREVVDSQNATIEIMVTGLAGTPIAEDFKNTKLENINSVVVNDEDKGSIEFELIPEETIALNTNDYLVVYKTV